MKNILFLFLIGIIVTLIATGPTLGSMLNPRQFSTASYLQELQDEFDAIGATSIAAYGDQLEEAYFVPTGAGNTTAAYVATISYYGMPLEFGIYELGNTSNMLEVFSLTTTAYPGGVSSLPAGYSVGISFDAGTNTVKSYEIGTLTEIDSTTYFGEFGFYIYNSSSGEGYLYSEDALNPMGLARILSYASEGDEVTIGSNTFYDDDHYYIAGEAGDYYSLGGNVLDSGSPGDFTDIIVQMESIKPVPVPAAILLGILGMSVAGLKLRKHA